MVLCLCFKRQDHTAEALVLPPGGGGCLGVGVGTEGGGGDINPEGGGLGGLGGGGAGGGLACAAPQKQ